MDRLDSRPVYQPPKGQGRQETSLHSDVNLRSEGLGSNQPISSATYRAAGDSGYASQSSSGSPGASVNTVAESLGAASISPQRFIDPIFCYKMDHARRGKCIIFNNTVFDPVTKMAPRTGSDIDAKNMYEIFQSVLQFDVDLHMNETALGMLQTVAEVENQNFADTDCFALVILSHGDDGVVYGRDGFIKLDVLIEPLKGCPSLNGKPKLIFIQACRGKLLDEGVIVSDAKPDEENKKQKEENAYKIPTEADFLYAFSSAQGYYSFRNSTKGSWFIQAITDVFRKEGTRLEIMQLMTRVNRMVAYDFESRSKDKNYSGMKQVPSVISLLTRELYFWGK